MFLESAAYQQDPSGDGDEVLIPTTQMQLRPKGAWHRRGPIPIETACGIPLPIGGFRTREYELEGEFCPDCFSARECILAAGPNDKGG